MARHTAIRAMLFDAVHLFPGLRAEFQDEVFHAPGGLADLAFLHPAPHCCTPAFSLHERSGDVVVTAAALGRTLDDTEGRTWANGCRTAQHGSHRNGFRTALRSVGWTPSIALVHIVTHGLQYDGPTMDRLLNKSVGEAVEKVTRGPLEEYCRAHGIARS